MLSEFQVEVLRRQYQHSQLFVVIGSQTLLYTYVALRGVATWPQKAVHTNRARNKAGMSCMQPVNPQARAVKVGNLID